MTILLTDTQPEPIFPKVACLDTVYGRVNFRKVYGNVQSPAPPAPPAPLVDIFHA